MNKKLNRVFAFAFAACIAAAFFACSEDNPSNPGGEPQGCDDPECSEPSSSSGGGEPQGPYRADGPVQCYGELKVDGNKLVGSKTGGEHVQVRGVSFGWSITGWESARFFLTAAVNAMVDDWKAEIIRAPLGIGSNGYINVNASGQVSIQGKDANKNRVKTVIDAAIEKGVYAIIDWHSHGAHRPAEQEEAIAFFREMAQQYGRLDNVIFEIYNEPVCQNGSTSCGSGDRTTWAQIKSYAEAVIPVIREHSDNLILVGTPYYCQTIEAPINDRISDSNVAYVFHFYAFTHYLDRPNNGGFRPNLNNALNSGLPVFISEYGTTASDGGQGQAFDTHNAERADAWHAFMDENKISSAAWQINDKAEGSCFYGFNPRQIFDFNSGNYGDENKMSASGKYIYNKLKGYDNEGLAWHNCKHR